MKKSLGWFVASALTLGGVSALHAQQSATFSPPLLIEGKNFRVGMSRPEAMTLLSECCYVSPEDPSAPSLFIRSKKTKEFLGAIFFRNGRVSSLRRDLKQSSEKAATDLILQFYRSILGDKQKTQAVVTVTAEAVEGGNFVGRMLTFTFPDGRVLVLKHNQLDDGTVAVDLSEER